jgi:KDO2-lipid IV(A) lauroyltransferase
MVHYLIRVVSRLPLRLLHAAGAFLGWASYGMSPTYRRHLRENLAQAGYTDARVRRGAIAAAGRMFAELPAIWLRPREEVLRWVLRVEGGQLIDEARAKGLGIIYLTPHQGCFEIAAQFLAERAPITVLYRAPKLGFLQPIMEEGRGQRNVRLAPADLGGVKELLAALKRRETVGILPDQVPGQGEGEWAEFFGRFAYTMTLAAKLAARPATECLLLFAERMPKGAGYVLHFERLPAPIGGESEVQRLNRGIEMLIRRCPEQYLWGYNRYKVPRGATPPPGKGAS